MHGPLSRQVDQGGHQPPGPRRGAGACGGAEAARHLPRWEFHGAKRVRRTPVAKDARASASLLDSHAAWTPRS